LISQNFHQTKAGENKWFTTNDLMRCNCYQDSGFQLIPVGHLGSAILDPPSSLLKHHHSKAECGKSVWKLKEFSLLIQSTHYEIKQKFWKAPLCWRSPKIYKKLGNITIKRKHNLRGGVMVSQFPQRYLLGLA